MLAAQKYIWLDQAIHGQSSLYNIGGYIAIAGRMDIACFNSAVNRFVRAQEVFSYSFTEEYGIPAVKQQAHGDALVVMNVLTNGLEGALEWIKEDFSTAFRLDAFPLYRFVLLQYETDKYFWYAKVHHIIADGMSFQLVFNQVNFLYRELLNKREPALAPPSFSLVVEEDEQYRSSAFFDADRAYWVNKLSAPVSYIFSEKNTLFSGPLSKEFTIGSSLVSRLSAFASANNISLFTLFSSLIGIYISRCYRNNDVTIGFPVMNRSRRFSEVTGLFINVLTLRLQAAGELTLKEWLHLVKRESGACLRHQRFLQSDMLRTVPARPVYNRFYDIRLSYEVFQYDQMTGDVSDWQINPLSNGMEEDPVSIHIMEHKGKDMVIRFDFNPLFIREDEALQMVQSIKWMTESVIEEENTTLAAFSIASPETRETVLSFSKGTPAQRPADMSFLHCWNEAVTSYPGHTAISCGGKNFTYTEISKKANRLAAALRKRNVSPGDKVSILLDRDENIVIAMLAIMKCRAIIVAMDKEYPLARLQYIAVNSGCRLCITDSEGSLIADNTDTISPPEIYDLPAGDMLNETAPNGYAPAYIIYTSGSTGAPKGVVISHASLYDYVKNFCAWFRLTEKDSVLQQSSFCFDTSIEETFPILAAGGRLVIAANNKDIPQLLDETVREGITVLSTNPWVVQFLNNDSRTLAACKLRILISGGDVLKPEFISRLSGRFDLYNTYGPTESTVCATYYKIENVTEQVIPIGKPITNRNIYIVDDYDNLQLPGLAGEICIAGAGLAMRYHEMPEQTAKSFVFLPACGEKVYRTGDLGIWLPDGNIVFAGRKDRQISINGFRIEPGEIEHCINSVKGITDSLVVAVNTNGHKILVAYVVSPEENRPGIAEIKNAIGGRLPAPMMPSSIVIMEQFPLLPNGKIDYSKLPAPGNDAVTMEYEAPATPLEEKLAAVWKQLLNRTEVGRNNDFFELGGHSLLANQFVSIVREECGTELSLKTFYRNPNIRMLAAVINESLAGSNELTVITPAPADADIPLSYAQERLWFLNQLDENNTAYNVPRALKMTGELHMDILESVFTKLVERHTILRTVFRIKDGAPVQVVLPPAHFHIPVLDYSGIDEGQRMQTIKEFILQEGNQRFDLANGPLLKVTILSLAPKESILVLCEHHLVHDGWTQGVLLNEFIQIYSAELSGQPFPFAPLSIQYGDFAYWQKKYYNEEKLKESLAYWVQQLNGLDPGLNLPVYKPRPAVNTGRGDMEVMHIPGDVYFRLLDFCAAYNVTPFMTMLGVFKLVLHKYSRNTDICVGTGVANRRIKELNNMLGMVINTIALRTRIEPGNDFLELVNTVKKVCIEGYANEDVPFGEVVNAVNPVRSLSAHPLVQYMFSFMNTPTRHIDLPGLNVEILESYNHSAKFDICIVVVMPVDDPYRNETAAHNPEIIIEWEYNSSIFEKPAMQSMLASFVRLLSEVLADPRRSLDAVNILSAAEERSVLSFSYQSCNPDGSINPLKQRDTLVSLFETQVMHTPQNTALCYNNTVFSYSTLNAVANKLADCLRKEYGLQPGELAAIQLGKNEWQIISILAILKTGAAYVPLGADYPKERTAFMLADCKCRVIIDDAFIKEFAAQQVGYTDANPGAAIGPDSLAYIIYTSGSTGLPKGVMTAHAAAVNLVAAQISAFGIDAAENILQLSAITFDASVEQIFIALTSGACLTLADKDTITDPEKMDSFIANNYITHIHTVPGLLKTFRVKQYPSLKRVIAGGDRCPASLAKDWSRVHTFYNEYGPTETTVTSIELFYTADVEVNTTVPVGRPLANTRVYILDESGNLVPEGVAGEICIGGAGIAKGYLNRPELTAEKFIPDPFYKGGTIYKTGDTGRWLPGGIIEFIGRADEQVKIRGYRIELGEIEHALQNLPGMEAAAVTVHKAEDGENELLAYIVTAQQTDSAVIRQQLNKSLPPYMIPAHFIQIDEMPVTPSGKTDKKKLPSPGTLIMKTGTQYIAPRTETERKLIPIWQEVLGKEQISVTDNFFNLGGHSLKVTKVIARIQDRFGVKPDIKEFFGEPTIEYLAEYLDTIAWIDGKPEETLAGPEEIII